jgi:outer membrane protein assembly factor BamA
MRQEIPVILLPFLIIMILPAFLFAENSEVRFSQDTLKESVKQIRINRISIEGNKQTRAAIILREMAFHENDTLPYRVFPELVKRSGENVFNSRLFNFVTLDTICTPGPTITAEVTVHVVERWYIWPIPYFEISDRNFNAWLESMDFSRLTYGIDLTVYNFRGRNETLRFPVRFGYNRLFGIDYSIPYINHRKTIGIEAGAELVQNHDLTIGSVDNKPVHYKDPDNFARQNIYAFAEISYRPGIHAYHSARLIYNSYIFPDTVLHIPNYTYGDKKTLNFFAFYYEFKLDHRDVGYYPLKGTYFDLSLTQNGFWTSAVNDFHLESNFRLYLQLQKRWYLSTGLAGKYTPTGSPVYFLQQGLGYGRNFVRGYEYYVVDGEHFLLFKSNLKFCLVQPRLLNIRFIKTRKFNPIPYAFYLNLFGDLGYAFNNDRDQNRLNDLQNTVMAGYGIGIDFTTYYDNVVRVEFSMNRMGIPGVYLHFMAPL